MGLSGICYSIPTYKRCLNIMCIVRFLHKKDNTAAHRERSSQLGSAVEGQLSWRALYTRSAVIGSSNNWHPVASATAFAMAAAVALLANSPMAFAS